MPFYLRLLSPHRAPRFASEGLPHDPQPIPFTHPEDPGLLQLALANQKRGGSHLVLHYDSPPDPKQLVEERLHKPHAQESTQNPIEQKPARKTRKPSDENLKEATAQSLKSLEETDFGEL